MTYSETFDADSMCAVGLYRINKRIYRWQSGKLKCINCEDTIGTTELETTYVGRGIHSSALVNVRLSTSIIHDIN